VRASGKRSGTTPSTHLKQLVDTLVLRGISLPVLVRFAGIMKHRLGELQRGLRRRHPRAQVQRRLLLRLSHQGQSTAPGRRGSSRIRQALQVRHGSRSSKPELLAVMALVDNDTPIICNGFKDAEFIETAMLAAEDRPAHHPGRGTVLRTAISILEYAEKLGVRPRIGMRVEARHPRQRAAGRRPAASQQVRPHRQRIRRSALELLARTGHGRLPASCCTSTRAARSRTSATSRPPLNEASRIYAELW
jgi:arginine decarboxylase-like protein